MIHSCTVTCTATGNLDDPHGDRRRHDHSVTVGGLTTMSSTPARSHASNVNGDSEPSEPSAPFTPTASGAQFSAVIDTSAGGDLELIPDAGNFQGTVGRITIPPQGGTGVQVTVTASLFGTPGEADATCGGNICIGQGIEWGVSDPGAVHRMRIAFLDVHVAGSTPGPEDGGRLQGWRPPPRLHVVGICRLRPVPDADAARRVVGDDPGER